MLTKDSILNWLDEVKDPEIPVLSVVDMGIIQDISFIENNGVKVVITPTFVGCPAIDIIKKQVEKCLLKNGLNPVEINVDYTHEWSTDRISEKGRKAMKEFGLAPPPAKKSCGVNMENLALINCPWCSSKNTILRSVFGSTLCRSIHYCNDCKQGFEQFKPL